MRKSPRVGRVRALLLAAIVASVGIGSATADEHHVSQKSRKFSPAVIQAKVGDTVVFVNDDRFAHNIYSETPGYEFDIRKQMPGDRQAIELTKPGTIDIRCAIHPRMRMRIVVK